MTRGMFRFRARLTARARAEHSGNAGEPAEQQPRCQCFPLSTANPNRDLTSGRAIPQVGDRPSAGQCALEPAQVAWHALEADAVFSRLVSSRAGLTSAVATERLIEYGPNELAFVGRKPWWRVLARQFVSPLIAILLVAALIAAVQQHWVDAVAIFLVLTLNASIGFVQERKADADVRALNSLSSPSCRVLRDGDERVIASRDVVPGDVVLLESGERVPADLRLFDSNGLRLDESMLTGESAAATKSTAPSPLAAIAGDKTCIAFSGTFVASGRGRGVAFATGSATELGEINELVRGPAGETPLQLLTDGLERRIGILVLIAVVFVFIAGLAVGNDPSQMFRTAVALAVATIPESLPIVLTVAMSVGVSRMARLNAIIRTLPAVETLGSTNIIGSDKTGTSDPESPHGGATVDHCGRDRHLGRNVDARWCGGLRDDSSRAASRGAHQRSGRHVWTARRIHRRCGGCGDGLPRGETRGHRATRTEASSPINRTSRSCSTPSRSAAMHTVADPLRQRLARSARLRLDHHGGRAAGRCRSTAR